jgi:hypothetical protein
MVIRAPAQPPASPAPSQAPSPQPSISEALEAQRMRRKLFEEYDAGFDAPPEDPTKRGER